MIWFALLIPVIAIAVVARKFSKKIAVWEYAVLFLVPAICIVIAKVSSTWSQTADKEYWNTYGTKAVYEERWDEEVSCSHPRYETEYYTDSEGRSQSRQVQNGYEHMYDVDSHPPKWYLKDNMGGRYGISQNYFEQICKLWAMRQFKDMHRDYHSYDGDAYISNYDKIFEHTIPLCKIHRYKNKVQCSKSVFNFEEVNEEMKAQYQLYDYPKENLWGFNPIMGGKNSEAVARMQKYNALNGSRSQLHMMVLVFKDQPIEAGFFQEAYWKGGNKNEFILCIGVNGDDIRWTKVISWTDEQTLKIKIAREIKEMKKLDMLQVVDYIGTNVPQGFIRKEFADFDYIAIRPTNGAILITFIITFIMTVGIGIFVVMNGQDFGGINNRKWRRRF